LEVHGKGVRNSLKKAPPELIRRGEGRTPCHRLNAGNSVRSSKGRPKTIVSYPKEKGMAKGKGSESFSQISRKESRKKKGRY